MLKKTILVIPATVLLLLAVQSLIAQPPGRGSGDKLNKNRSVAPVQPPMPANEKEKQILSVLEDMYKNQRAEMMNVSEEDGRMLRLLAEATCAKHIVEIGTGNGYSGIWFCLALWNTGGKLVTYEIDAHRAELARKNFERAGLDRVVKIVEGDAHETVKNLKGTIDILFLDADKEGYTDYLNKLLPLVRPGGLILAHNADDAEKNFIKAITTDPNLETVFRGRGQGLSMILKKRPLFVTTIVDVGYISSPNDVVDKMLELAEVKKDDLVYDLGCGDGRIVVASAKKYGCKAVGYDTQPRCIKEALENVQKNKVEHLVGIEQKDIFTLDLSQASVITLYLNPVLNLKLIPQLKKLRPGSRIVSHECEMEGVEPDKVEKLVSSETNREHTIYLFTTPLKITKEIKIEISEEDTRCPWCGSPRR
jgi:predicted O-methyltransferase YrrM